VPSIVFDLQKKQRRKIKKRGEKTKAILLKDIL
jgi:hypothetical protein